MGEKGKKFFLIVLGISILVCGIWVGKSRMKKQPERPDGSAIVMRYWNSKKEGEGKREYDVIKEKQERFLEEHLYGQWRFSEQIVEAKVKDIYDSEIYNFTKEGIQELKEMVLVEYQKDWVKYPLKEGQQSFRHPKDMWLYGVYGGFTWGKEPIYSLEKKDNNYVFLRNIANRYDPYSYGAYIPKMEHWIQVTYTVRTLEGGSEYLGYQNDYFGSHIYIDPEDTETIYIDFCGLWKMKRNPNNDLVDREGKQESFCEKRKEEGEYSLTEEEQTFLEEHLYGLWKFSKRIVELKEIDSISGEVRSNFSYLGRECIKEGEKLHFGEEEVEKTSLLSFCAFSNVYDMYLYGIYGGFSYSQKPVFSLEIIEGDTIELNHVFQKEACDKVQAEWMKGFVHVTYFTLDSLEETRRMGNYFANHIYIDPNDTETIYVDFCGLWEMKKYHLGDRW